MDSRILAGKLFRAQVAASKAEKDAEFAIKIAQQKNAKIEEIRMEFEELKKSEE